MSETSLLSHRRKRQAEERKEAAQRKALKAKPPTPSKYCSAKEPGCMRVCILPPNHEGDHDSGPGAKTWPLSAVGETDQWGQAVTERKKAPPKRPTKLAEWIDTQWTTWAPKTRNGLVIADVDRLDGLSSSTADVWHVVVDRGNERSLSGNYHELACGLKVRVREIVETKHDQVLVDDRGDRFDFCGGCVPTAEIERLRALAPAATRPAPMTLDDEPDDPAADAAAEAAIDREIAEEFEGAVQDEIASPSSAEERFRSGEAVLVTELLAAREAKRRAKKKPLKEKLKVPAPPMPAGSKICGYPRHPAAALYPMLEAEELAALSEDIKENGLRDPLITVDDGKKEWLLDGSNRGIACELAGVKPRFEEYTGKTDMDTLVAFVISKNDKRRHLSPSVRAMIAADAAKLGRGNPGKRETGRSAGLTQAESAKQLRVSERLVRKAVVVRDKATDKVREAVMKGKLAVDAAELVSKLPDAKQDVIADAALARKSGEIRSGKIRALVNQEKKRDVVRRINEQRVSPLPDGPFGLIYGDYPWHYDNSDQHEGSRGHLPYPTMEFDAVLAHALEVAKRAAKNCVIALWSTNLYVTRMDQVIQALGAERRTVFTWPKPKFGIGGWGRGQTEHLVIASIGEPTHTLNEVSTLLPSWQPAHAREHSSKPAEVAALLQKHCSGPFLELFGREQRDGWTVWGAEVEKFKRAA